MFKILAITLFALLAPAISQLTATTCTNVVCCRELANPNFATGDGFLEFDGDCLTGGLHCVDDTGCRLCHDGSVTTNAFSRPICDAAAVNPLPVCLSQACCNTLISPSTTGYGFLQFIPDCPSSQCVNVTNCADCFNPSVTNSSNVLNRTVCSAAAIASFNNLATAQTTVAQTTLATTLVQTTNTQGATTVVTSEAIPTSLVTSQIVPTVIASTLATQPTTQITPTTFATTQNPPTIVTTQAIPTTFTTQVTPTATTQVVPTTVVTTPTTFSIFTGQFSTFFTVATAQQGAASSLVPAGIVLFASFLVVLF